MKSSRAASRLELHLHLSLKAAGLEGKKKKKGRSGDQITASRVLGPAGDETPLPVAAEAARGEFNTDGRPAARRH